MSAIIKARNETAACTPRDPGNARVTGTGGLPPRGALTGDAAENLIDDSGMGDHKNPLARVDTGDRVDDSQDTPAKRTVCLATGPGEVLAHLGLIFQPELGIVLAHIDDRKPVHDAAIDFGQRL